MDAFTGVRQAASRAVRSSGIELPEREPCRNSAELVPAYEYYGKGPISITSVGSCSYDPSASDR